MRHGDLICETALGYPDPAHKTQPTDEQTLYDLRRCQLFTPLSRRCASARARQWRRVLPAFTGTRPIQPYEDPLDWGGWVKVQQQQSGVVPARLPSGNC